MSTVPTMNRYKTSRFVSKFFLHFVLIVGGLIMIFPMVWMIFSSFKPSLEVISVEFHLFPKTWTLRNTNDWKRLFEALPTGLPIPSSRKFERRMKIPLVVFTRSS